MEAGRIDFVVEEAGCLLWLAPMSLGGLTPLELAAVWMGEAPLKVADLVAQGTMMPMSLYQDDGYLVRVAFGDLTEQEEAEWTARVRWRLNVPCGRVLVSGVLSPDFDEEFGQIVPASHQGSYWAGGYVEVRPGEYLVEVYAYPPGDLSGGWGHIEDPDLFGKVPGIQPEDALTYFRRSHPSLTPPAWISGDYDETTYVNFIVRISPLTEKLLPPKLEEDGCIQWEFRKPAVCPLGIRSDYGESAESE